MQKEPRICITGATGLLGRALMLAFADLREDALIGLCWRRRAGRCHPLDLCQTSLIAPFLDRFSPSVVIHAAAERHPDISQRDPVRTRLLNVEATRGISRWCAARGATLVYLSTDYVFDGTKAPYSPDDPPSPVNAYGESKLAGERAVFEEMGEDAITLRVPILYGPTAEWGESAVTQLARKMADTPGGECIGMDDWAIRYPTLTSDVAGVIRKMVEYRGTHPDFGGIFHWSGNEAMTKYEMARKMAGWIGFDPRRLIPLGEPPADGTPRPKNARLACSRLERLGIGFRTPFDRACRAILSR